MVKGIQELKQRWHEKAEEIKKQKFDENQVFRIKEDFLDETLYFSAYNNKSKCNDFVPEFKEILNDLSLALEIAYSNYLQEKKGILSRIFGGIKELHLLERK